MRYLLVVTTTLVLLGYAEPVADAGPVAPATSARSTSESKPPAPSSSGLPFRLVPEEKQCVVPVSARLLPCGRVPHRVPRSCVLPVQAPGVRVPDCPRPETPPEGRVVPLQSLTEE